MKKIFFLIIILGCLLTTAVYIAQGSIARPHHFKVTFLDVGQGDSALIQFANGQKMLVDCGANKGVLARLSDVLPFYDRAIDYVLATHPDLDHYGGCIDVIKRYRVSHIITNGRAKPGDPYWEEWQRSIEASGAEISEITAESTWVIASSTLHFLSPDSTLPLKVAGDDSNNFSIVFKLTADTGQTFLFTGDMEVPLETALINRYCSDLVTSTVFAKSEPCAALQSAILKVGHHGSNSSSGLNLLEAVRPRLGLVSVGVKNRYGHPSLRVLKRLERAGMVIRRTDQEGSIVVE